MSGDEVDWEALRAAAREVAGRAHAPYSGLRVGAAGLTDAGRMLSACNVENASYGLSLCAECGLVAIARAAGSSALRAVSVVAGGDRAGEPLSPCGRCRQLLLETGGPELLVDRGAGNDPVALGVLLPGAFDAGALP